MKRKRVFIRRSVSAVFFVTMLISMMGFGLFGSMASAQCPNDGEFTSEFRLQDCTFQTSDGNPYFILEPGYQQVLEGEEVKVQITVLNETEDLLVPGIGQVRTRVVEEREWEDGELIEVSRNFFAICKETNAVYYFGEDVDIYEDGEIVSHDGAWRAGENGAMPGLMMPGTFLLGSKYFQEIAWGAGAVDRGENTAMGLTVTTEAGTFNGCVEVVDTNSSELICDREEGDTKVYCPGVGLVIDEDLELVSFGKENDEAMICATFGTSGFHRDQDTFRFFGTKGETVTVRLEADPPEAGSGRRATLVLKQQTGFFRITRYFGTLPHEITATLPASGEYHVIVAEQLRSIGQGNNGDYCVTLQGSPETCQTFEAVSVD